MRRITLAFVIAARLLLGSGELSLGGQSRNLTDAAYKDRVLRKVAGIVESRYVLAEKARAYAEEFRAKCRAGTYRPFVDPKEFAARVTADLVAITHDKHLNFRVVAPSDVGEKATGTLHHPIRYYRLRMVENVGFAKLEWIEPRIGYIDLRRFYSFDQAKPMALAAMTFLANASAIIIDVRENGGGSGDYLSSYFLPFSTELCGVYTRADGLLTRAWTRRDIGMEPRTDVPLFILVGPNTFSAAECFAYDMQSRKRATLVGEPTKGGAHDVDLFAVDDLFEFYVSTGRAVSPVTGGNWEGTGVIPEIRVPASSALDAALAEARKAAEMFGRKEDAALNTAADEMQGLADEAVGHFRKGESGSGGAALDRLFQTAARAGMLTEFFVDVFAYNFQGAGDEKVLLGILERRVALFPDSALGYERLAYLHLAKGDRALALGYLHKVLALDPGNRNAAAKIKELEK
jgi:hypothetical protein